MMTKDKIIELLKNEFNSVYCNNCIGNDIDFDGCDYCHRKSMYWSINPAWAEALADKIIGE